MNRKFGSSFLVDCKTRTQLSSNPHRIINIATTNKTQPILNRSSNHSTMRLLLLIFVSFLYNINIVDALLSVRPTTRSKTLGFCLPSLGVPKSISSRRFMASSSLNATSKRRALYSFDEARKIARGHGFSSLQEFLDYDCAGAYQVPKNADEVWSEDFTTWEDFLGIILEFEEAREVARKTASERNISTQKEYMRVMESKTIEDGDIASRLPYRPDLKYKTRGWISWEDFLQEPCLE